MAHKQMLVIVAAKNLTSSGCLSDALAFSVEGIGGRRRLQRRRTCPIGVRFEKLPNLRHRKPWHALEMARDDARHVG